MKIGLEWATSLKWDENSTQTSYGNVSITAYGIATAWCFFQTGQWLGNFQNETQMG